MKLHFWVGVVIFAFLGVLTLTPAHVTEPNLLGYYSFDPLAPITAILLWVGAGTIYWHGKENERSRKLADLSLY